MMKTPQSAFVRDKALAVGVRAIKPAASALPLTGQPSLAFVSRKALAAGSSASEGKSKAPAASALPLTVRLSHVLVSRKARVLPWV